MLLCRQTNSEGMKSEPHKKYSAAALGIEVASGQDTKPMYGCIREPKENCTALVWTYSFNNETTQAVGKQYDRTVAKLTH